MSRTAAARLAPPLRRQLLQRANHGLAPLLLGALVAVNVLIATPRQAHACSCAETDLAARRDAATAVFEGRVRAIAREGNAEVGPAQLRVTLEIVQTWKGADTEEIVVTTASDDAACGVPFETDRSYLVFATSDASGRFFAGLCGGTRPREAADDDVAALGAGVTPVDVRDAPASPRATPPGSAGCASCHVGGVDARRSARVDWVAWLVVVVTLTAARRRVRSRRRARAPRRALSP